MYVYKNGNRIETISTTETTYSLENLTNGTDERFKVRAYSLKNDGTKKYGDFSSTLKVRTLPGKVESVAQKECDAMVMLQAKGFSENVVSINGEFADVCIGMNELSQVQIAQIEDIVKRKTGIPAENITISPVGQN